MKNVIARKFWAGGTISIWVGLTFAACSGGSAAVGGTDAGTGDDGQATGPACTMDADCASQLPATDPPNCATGKCDALQGVCTFVAKDADGDGHPAAHCKAVGSGTIQAGDDCDDLDNTTYPGATDVCDGKNHTCSTTQCACANGTAQACYEGTPASTRTVGACKDGSQLCTKGQWGTCDGQVKPKPVDLCDGKDENCDGNPNTNCPCQTGATQVCNMGLCNPTTVTCTNGAWPTCPSAIVIAAYRQDGDADQHCVGGGLMLCPGAAASHVPAVRLSSTCLAPDDCDDSDAQRASACNCATGASKGCNPSPACNPSSISCVSGNFPACPAPSNPTFAGSPIGSACSSGTGACQSSGTIVCAGTNAASCNALAGAPVAQFDFRAQSAPNGSWDWNCDNTIEREHNDFTYSAGFCANPGQICSLLTNAADCTHGLLHSQGIGEFWVGACDNPSQNCGGNLLYQQCWWQGSSNSCKVGAGSTQVVRCN